MNVAVQTSFWVTVFISFWHIPRSGIVDHLVDLFLISWGTSILFFQSGWTNLQSHEQYTRVPFSTHSCQHLLSLDFSMIAILTGVGWELIVVLICISLLTSDFSDTCWPFIYKRSSKNRRTKQEASHFLISRYTIVQFSSVAHSCLTLCNPMIHSTPVLPVHHQLPEFTQTHVHRVSDAIQPSHPVSSPSPPAPNPSQHQSLLQWVNSSHEVAKVLEFQL